ncbi:MAG: VWA-like domain-containing protein [Eubacterium sp.]|nr:VWA-like domain-containing protein [Eubacterium sp.]
MDNKNTQKTEKDIKIEKLAAKVMDIARDRIAVSLRFLDIALAEIKLIAKKDIKDKNETSGGGMATDGQYVYYDPEWVLRTYKEEPSRVTRTYLHLLLHLIFFHPFSYDKLDKVLWDLASDVAVESAIISMGYPVFMTERDAEAAEELKTIRRLCNGITAEKVYKYLRTYDISEAGKIRWFVLFHKDEHIYWRKKKEISIQLERWQKISERVKTDLKTFSKGGAVNEEIEASLTDATKEKYDYTELLQRFMTTGEDIRQSDDEFDYIYYSYGLEHYGNMPLIEPLEYRDSRKVREFIIALDTSASCKGAIVQTFLKKTYSILKSRDNFFTEVNIHIIQCDSQIRQDTKIKNNEEFEDFCRNIKLKGFGTTDFRPVFKYVDELIQKQEFENLKGLIYFTDGYGDYPEKMPDYDVMFAFLAEDEYAPKPPVWAYKIVLQPEELEAEAIRIEREKREEAIRMSRDNGEADETPTNQENSEMADTHPET